jgi:hypothetical protein
MRTDSFNTNLIRTSIQIQIRQSGPDMSIYQYSQLSQSPASPDRIRLLRLFPEKIKAGLEPGVIRCELFEYNLHDEDIYAHDYEALSYTWGSSGNRRTIYIEGHSLLVTANLYAALLHLRDGTIQRELWIDAICINQGDYSEKEKQIQMMSKIYCLARHVIVWLGVAADESDLALERIVHIVGPVKRSAKILANEKGHGAVIKLLRRPWFERIWVS